MATREATQRLDGYVQIDDAYLGGERNGSKVGRGAPGKQPLLATIETDAAPEHPRDAVLEPVRAFDNASLQDRYARRLAPTAEVYSDGLACLARAVDTGHAHSVLATAGGRAATQVRGAHWVNVILANAKRAISGRCHAFKHSKYARLYSAESQYRFNLVAMVPRLLWATMLCKPCPELMLCAAHNFHS